MTLAFVLGVVTFFLVFGAGILNVENVGWLMKGDWAQHFIGWHAFRHDSWHMPPGATDALNWPIGTSVVYTDSLPLFSVPLKVLSPLLPQTMQFQGVWFLLSLGLQGLFGYLVVQRLSGHTVPAVVSALLLVLLPSVFQRIAHDTLIAQWIILAAIYVYLEPRSKKSEIFFFIVIAISLLVHFYISFLVLSLWGTWWLQHLLNREDDLPWKAHFRWNFLRMGLWLALSAGLMWTVGYFVISPTAASSANGFGLYSMNLNAFINPQA
jgi:hypothetical protein